MPLNLVSYVNMKIVAVYLIQPTWSLAVVAFGHTCKPGKFSMFG